MAWEDRFACVTLIAAVVCVLSSYLAYCYWSVSRQIGRFIAGTPTKRDVDEVKRSLDGLEDEIRRTTDDMIRTVERFRKWLDEG